MKKISLLVVVVGVLLMFFSNAYAYPGTISIDSQQHSGMDYTTGFEMFFETGTYEFSIESGAWNDRGFFPGSWIWSANIYQESTGQEFMLGDNVMHYSNAAAITKHANDASVQITVGNPSGENLSFYIYSESAHNNRSTVTMNVNTPVAPEPVSSVLFVVGGLAFAGRRYFKKNHN